MLLAVEVVDGGTLAADRALKPGEYARAGIEHYWRVETDPDPVVHTFRLAENTTVYVATGVSACGQTVHAPGLEWVQVDVDHLAHDGDRR